jgi:hypothetical protein
MPSSPDPSKKPSYIVDSLTIKSVFKSIFRGTVEGEKIDLGIFQGDPEKRF